MTDMKDLKGNVTIDPAHSTIGFIARHAMITKVRGAFDEFSGEGFVDGANPSDSHVTVTIDVNSVTTRQEARDNHLRSADFFDAEKYPTITFKSTDVKTVGEDTVDITGDLTIRDVTQSLTIPFQYTGTAKDPYGNQRVGFEGGVDVNRKDFGLSWNAALETGGVMVSERIKLFFEIEAIITPEA